MGANPTVSERKTWTKIIFGGDLKSGKAWGVFLTRMALGITFLWAGYEKIIGLSGSGGGVAGFLSGASVAKSPLAGFFNSLSGNLAVTNLVMYGEFLIGVSLVLGIFTRIGAVSGILQMALFTLAMWPIQDKPTDNPLVDVRIFYGMLFVALFFLTPGRFLGLDGIVQKSRFIQGRPTLARLLAKIG